MVGEILIAFAVRTTGAAFGSAGREGFTRGAGGGAFIDLAGFALIGAAGFFFSKSFATLDLACLLLFLAMGSLGKARIRRSKLQHNAGKRPRACLTPTRAPNASSADTGRSQARYTDGYSREPRLPR